MQNNPSWGREKIAHYMVEHFQCCADSGKPYTYAGLITLYRSILDKGIVMKPSNTVADQSNDDLYFEYEGQAKIRNVEEAIIFSKADLSIWEVDRQLFNSWETTLNTDKGIKQVTNVQVKLWFKKKKYTLDQFKADMMKEFSKIRIPKVAPKKQKEGYLLEIDMFDSHIGKLAIEEETGDPYNLKIAEERHFKALSSILDKTKGEKIEKILFPIGNDWLHIDNMNHMTTGGTKQDVDGKWQQVWMAGRRILVESILMLKQIAPVEIPRVPSNHDFENMFYMADLLKVMFEKDKFVTIDNSPKTRKYYKFGKCGIAYTHSNEEKLSLIPLLVLNETRKIWGDVDFIEVHLGHIHTKRDIKFLTADEQTSVTLRFLRSLSSADAWHYKKGYTGNLKGCESFYWDKEHGLVKNFFENIA